MPIPLYSNVYNLYTEAIMPDVVKIDAMLGKCIETKLIHAVHIVEGRNVHSLQFC